MLKKQNTFNLRADKTFFKRARKQFFPYGVLFYVNNNGKKQEQTIRQLKKQPEPHVTVIVPKKVGNAVVRNQQKRIGRSLMATVFASLFSDQQVKQHKGNHLSDEQDDQLDNSFDFVLFINKPITDQVKAKQIIETIIKKLLD